MMERIGNGDQPHRSPGRAEDFLQLPPKGKLQLDIRHLLRPLAPNRHHAISPPAPAPWLLSGDFRVPLNVRARSEDPQLVYPWSLVRGPSRRMW
jgi:hypothetical protein